MAVISLGTSVATASPAGLADDDRALLAAYARDTWHSIEALTVAGALPADSLRHDGDAWVPTGLTSPSNIAAYLWSTLAAEDLRLIARDESSRRLGQTLAALSRLERSHGFFYNWYDPATGERARTWPAGGPLRPFLSSVDNGWLASALMLIANARPDLRGAAETILAPMDFGFFYNPFDPANPIAHPGLLRGGFWPEEGTFTEFHYGTLNTEPRIASYVGIARGQLPADHYYRMARAWSDATAPTRTYAGVAVAEGSLDYRGLRLVPSWDGTMFEALMVSLFVPEGEWAPESWGINHPLYVRAQIEYGLKDARLGYWGISASTDPAGGYHAYGVAGIGAWSRTQPPSGRQGVVTPHASFLALRFAPLEAMANLRALVSRFAVYGPNGFLDSVDVNTGRVSDRVLVLDQGMILAAIANALRDDTLLRSFSGGTFEAAIRPLIASERFSVGIDVTARPPDEDFPALATALVAALAPPAPATARKDDAEVPAIPRPHVVGLATAGEVRDALGRKEDRPGPHPAGGSTSP